jgi:transcriptional repressor NrdR
MLVDENQIFHSSAIFIYSLPMFCPRSKHDDTSEIDSRLSEEGRAVRRRRECPKCQHRFTTFERQELSSLIVVKRDGTREPYSRGKLERGIWLACTKRPVTQEKIDRLLTKLEEKWGANRKEVSSSTIGTDVMRELKKLDQVAYIRFASVHREFKDEEEFKEELGRLFK